MSINLKKLQIHLLGLGALAMCLICTYGFGIRPVLQAQEELRKTVAEAEQLQRMLPTLKDQIAGLHERIEQKSKELQECYSLVTPAGQPLLGIVAELLANRRVELINLREEAKNATGQRTLVLQLSSVYGDMMSLIHDLRKLDCPARISHLRLTPLDGQGERCSATLTVHFSDVVPLPGPLKSLSLTSTAEKQA